MTQYTGMADVWDGVIEDLRSHQPLQDHLDDPRAVQEGFPNEFTGDHPVGVMVQVVWDGSARRGGYANRRTVRVQCSIVASRKWREEPGRPDASVDQTEILDRCADRLDVACGETLPGVTSISGGGMGSSTGLEDVGGGYVAAHGDWRFRYTEIAPTDN